MERTVKPSLIDMRIDTLPNISVDAFENNIPFFVIPIQNTDLVKMTFLFKGGAWVQQHPLQAVFAFNQIKDGTKSKTAQQINQLMDFYGAYFSVSVYKEFAYISVMCLKKFLKQVLDVLADVFNNPIYEEEAFQLALDQRRTNLLVNLGKVKYQADKLLYQTLFGPQHPMGSYSMPEDFNTIDTTLLKSYFQQFITADNCTMIISGNIDDNTHKLIADYFGSSHWGGGQPQDDICMRLDQHKDFVQDLPTDVFHVNMPENQFQAAVYAGRVEPVLDVENKAYTLLANTMLGGYFGSRLMKNIREKNGYTYGIYSSIVTVRHYNVFTIQTETAKQHVEDVIREVKKEIDLICNGVVCDEELRIVKNYYLGRLARNLEANFSYSNYIARKIIYGIDLNEDMLIGKYVLNAKPFDVQNAAQFLLKPDNFIWCVAG